MFTSVRVGEPESEPKENRTSNTSTNGGGETGEGSLKSLITTMNDFIKGVNFYFASSVTL